MSANVVLGIPASGPPTWRLLESIVRLNLPPGGILFKRAGGDDGLAPDIARNALVRHCLRHSDAEWLWQVDRDAALHPDTLLRLLSWDQPIVSALCFTRRWPVAPTIYGAQVGTSHGLPVYQIQLDETREWLRAHQELWTPEPVVLEPRPADALVRTTVTGAHCLLIHRRVLEAIPPPWFELHADWDRHPEAYGGDDFTFCRKAGAAGFPVYVDRSCQAAHLFGERPCGALDFLAYDKITDWQAPKLDQ